MGDSELRAALLTLDKRQGFGCLGGTARLPGRLLQRLHRCQFLVYGRKAIGPMPMLDRSRAERDVFAIDLRGARGHDLPGVTAPLVLGDGRVQASTVFRLAI